MVSAVVSYEQPSESSADTEMSVSVNGGVIADRPVPTDVRASGVTFTDDRLRVQLADGREISAPLAWFPRLIEASVREREDYQLTDDGQLIHWPAVDEDIDVPNLLRM